MKTSLHTQLNQANLENRLHNSTENLKEGFKDTVFQHFVDELRRYNQDMRIDSSIFVFIFNIYCYIYVTF